MLHPVYDAYNEKKLQEIYEELEHLPRDPAFDFVQPNELEEIKKERPDGPRKLPLALNDTVKPLVFGFQEITIKELAERTLAVHQKVMAYADKR
jgi:hypothetical protein